MRELNVGDKLDQYVLTELLARSGMASIFKADDTVSGGAVAQTLGQTVESGLGRTVDGVRGADAFAGHGREHGDQGRLAPLYWGVLSEVAQPAAPGRAS